MDIYVIKIINIFLSLLGLLGVGGIIIGLPTGIVMIVTAKNQPTPAQQTSRRHLGIWLILGPWAMVIFAILAFVVVRVVSNINNI